MKPDPEKPAMHDHSALFDHLPVMFHSVDGDGNIADVNAFWLSRLGYARDEVVGRPMAEFMTPDSDADARSLDMAALRKSGCIHDVPCRFVAKDQSRVRVLHSAEAIVDNNGGIGGYRGIGSEFADEIEHREALEAARRDADEANRAKSEYVAMISHDLRTPVSSIKSAIDMMKHGIGGSVEDKGKEILAVADEACDRMIFMIDGLLDIELDIAEIIRGAVRINEPLAKNYGIELIVTELPADGAMVKGDAMRLQQVLDNLISNACKYSENGGKVEIAATVAKKRVTVSVRDHGAGIPENFQRRVFQPFAQHAAQSNTRHKGTGLGLNIVRALLRLHGGKLWYDTEVGIGTTFYFDLPLV